MSECFKPWRRKIGVVTMVVACVLTLAWTHSTGEVDFVHINLPNTNVVLISGGGELMIFRGMHFSAHHPGTTRGVIVAPAAYPISGDLVYYKAWIADKVGVFASEAPFITEFDQPEPMIPYWSIVSPVALLSAWLLLSKPRAKKPAVNAPAQT